MNGLIFSVLLLGIITFFYRYSFISSRGRVWAEKIPPEFLKLLAPATFAAIIANNLLSQNQNPKEFEIKAGVAFVSLIVAYFSKSILATLIFGLGLLYLVQNYLGVY